MSYVNGIEIDPVEFEEEPYYIVTVCNTRRCGILRFSEELAITLKDDHGSLKFISGWEINCGESWTWEPEDLDSFELDHPGLLDFIRGEIDARRPAAA